MGHYLANSSSSCNRSSAVRTTRLAAEKPVAAVIRPRNSRVSSTLLSSRFPDSTLPVDDDPFDVICLFSVFTHLAPDDYVNMLKVSRRYIREDGWLLFSTFIDDTLSTDFEDRVPGRPLLNAVYREGFARRMIAEARWEAVSFHPRQKHIQHHFVCRPRA